LEAVIQKSQALKRNYESYLKKLDISSEIFVNFADNSLILIHQDEPAIKRLNLNRQKSIESFLIQQNKVAISPADSDNDMTETLAERTIEDGVTKKLKVFWSETTKKEAEALLRDPCKSLDDVFAHFQYRIPRSTLYNWKKSGSEKKKVRGRRLISPYLESRFFDWFLRMRALKYPVNDQILLDKSSKILENELRRTLHEGMEEKHSVLPNLRLSLGWLQKFKKRNKIILRKITDKAKVDFKKLKIDLEKYFKELNSSKVTNQTVFWNMDETGVFFEMEHKETLDVSGTKCVGLRSFCVEKKRITVIVCVSSRGDTIPPIIVMKVQRPKDYENGDRPNEEAILGSPLLNNFIKSTGIQVIKSFSG